MSGFHSIRISIFVEALSSFAAQLALLHQGPHGLAAPEQSLLRVAAAPAAHDQVHRVVPDIVKQFERPHGVAAAQLHRHVLQYGDTEQVGDHFFD